MSANFCDVLAVDPQAGWVEAEGMVTYEALTAACLKHGVMPAVVPQLKTITLGGAVAGVGIESSSHRYGLVHDTVLELDVLLGDGRVVTCTRDNEHADLFFGFPNSYGTLGYALRVKAKAVPVRPYVHLAAPRLFRRAPVLPGAREAPARGRRRFCRRHRVRARQDVHHGGPLRRQGALYERLQLRAHLLPARSPGSATTT